MTTTLLPKKRICKGRFVRGTDWFRVLVLGLEELGGVTSLPGIFVSSAYRLES